MAQGSHWLSWTGHWVLLQGNPLLRCCPSYQLPLAGLPTVPHDTHQAEQQAPQPNVLDLDLSLELGNAAVDCPGFHR